MTTSLAQFSAIADLADWRALDTSAHAWFETPDLKAGAAFAAEVSQAADSAGARPRLVLTRNRVEVQLTSNDSAVFTAEELALAAAISRLARERALVPLPSHALVLTIAIDAMDVAEIRPFWQAVLGYRLNAHGNLFDPDGRGPKVWFQQLDTPRPQRNRVHVDVYVPHDDAVARVEAALIAGGTLLTDEFVPAWWVLADAEGNEACICTWQETGA